MKSVFRKSIRNAHNEPIKTAALMYFKQNYPDVPMPFQPDSVPSAGGIKLASPGATEHLRGKEEQLHEGLQAWELVGLSSALQAIAYGLPFQHICLSRQPSICLPCTMSWLEAASAALTFNLCAFSV